MDARYSVYQLADVGQSCAWMGKVWRYYMLPPPEWSSSSPSSSSPSSSSSSLATAAALKSKMLVLNF